MLSWKILKSSRAEEIYENYVVQTLGLILPASRRARIRDYRGRAGVLRERPLGRGPEIALRQRHALRCLSFLGRHVSSGGLAREEQQR